MDYEREIIDLHNFFEDWLHGELPNTETVFERVRTVLSPHFLLITPNGNVIDCETLLVDIRAGYAARPGLHMWIENTQLRQQMGDILIVTYEEWQTLNAVKTARISTAVFQVDASAPHGLSWLHVHETWLPL